VSVLPKLDHLLNLIQDGAWHSLQELAKNSNIPKQKLETLSKLLSNTNIIEYETKNNQVRIKKEWQRILKNTSNEPESEIAAVGTVVLPPKKNVEIQGIQLTNLTEKELEINIRVNKNLKELAIDTIEN
jgi:hypothetical protein